MSTSKYNKIKKNSLQQQTDVKAFFSTKMLTSMFNVSSFRMIGFGDEGISKRSWSAFTYLHLEEMTCDLGKRLSEAIGQLTATTE